MEVSIAKRTLAVLLSLSVLLLGAACGEEAGAGGDGEAQAPVGDFNDWDANNNDEINQQEFNEGVFGNWDANNSGNIEEEEFNTATDAWFGNFNGNFSDWDANNNDEMYARECIGTFSDVELWPYTTS
jgi:hypothetical protein